MSDFGLPAGQICDEIVARALAEDLGANGDVTTRSLIESGLTAAATIEARGSGTVAGLPLVARVFAQLDRDLEIELLAGDGQRVEAGSVLARVCGSARAILEGERVALNLLGRLSGVATATAALVAAVAGTGVEILDTRKTTPNLRLLERYAVRCGGGHNHRFGLFDQVLIKDNHLAAVGGVEVALRRARAQAPPGLEVEIEISGLDQLDAAIAGGADIVMLDNFGLAEMRRAVARSAGRVRLEASGGIGPESIRAVAETGVDRISVGAITHSAPALDVALEFAPLTSCAADTG